MAEEGETKGEQEGIQYQNEGKLEKEEGRRVASGTFLLRGMCTVGVCILYIV